MKIRFGVVNIIVVVTAVGDTVVVSTDSAGIVVNGSVVDDGDYTTVAVVAVVSAIVSVAG